MPSGPGDDPLFVFARVFLTIPGTIGELLNVWENAVGSTFGIQSSFDMSIGLEEEYVCL